MANAIDELAKFDCNGVKWLTKLRNEVCEKGFITTEFLLSIRNIVLDKEKFDDVPQIPHIINKNVDNELLYKLKNNQNICGLADNEEIVFSPYFTLIYGLNGTGKSSYYRLLKDCFHSPQNIKPNIYLNTGDPLNAVVDFVDANDYRREQRKGDVENFPKYTNTIQWYPSKPLNKSIKFCDNEILQKSLIMKDAGWSLDKFKLDYYSIFRKRIDDFEAMVRTDANVVKDTIKHNIDSIIRELKQESPDAIKVLLYENINNILQLIQIIDRLMLVEVDEDHDFKVRSCKEKLEINITDYYNTIQDIIKRKSKCLNLLKNLKQLRNLYDRIPEINKKIERKHIIEKSRDYSSLTKYELLFLDKNMPPTNSYINLIREIEKLANDLGFKQYPNDIKKCFYCNRSITPNEQELLNLIHNLTNSAIENELFSITKEINDFNLRFIDFKDIKDESFNDFDLKYVEIYDINSKMKIDITPLINELLNKDHIHKIQQNVINETPNNNYSIEKTTFLIQILQSEFYNYDFYKNENEGNFNKIESEKNTAKIELNNLLDIEFIVSHKVELKLLMGFLLKWFEYDTVIKSFEQIKSNISKDKTRVEKELLASRYNDNFYDYLKKFGLAQYDKIKRQHSNPGGQSKISSSIVVDENEYNTNEILSDGEAKVHSICDWFTELEFDDVSTLIFDDPMNSLDSRNMAQIAELIISLTNKYQIILFTHNNEFYRELLARSLGNKTYDKVSCEICTDEVTNMHCKGYDKVSNKMYKCGNYYILENAAYKGMIKNKIQFFSLKYNERLRIIRNMLLSANNDGVDIKMRSTINNFYEDFILANVKREVYKGQDLIHHQKDFRIKELSDEDYNSLLHMYNRLSAKSGIHEPAEIITILDNQELINIYNDFADILNKYQKDKPHQAEKIEIS